MARTEAGPRYAEVADAIWQAAVDSGARPGHRVASERALAARHGVSRETVRAALTLLSDRGVLRPSPARGWFVDHVPEASRGVPRHSVLGFADYARQHGLPTTTTVLRSGIRPAGVEEAESLRVAAGSDLFDMLRLRRLDGLAVVLERNRVPLRLCPALATTDFAHASLYATLRAADPPQYPQMAHYSVEARTPDGEESDLLDIDGPIPVLVATQLAFNQDHRPLELTRQVYRGDRYRFQASITD